MTRRWRWLDLYQQTRLLGAQIWLHDVDDWRMDNSRALGMARRMVSITRLIPDHEFANLDGFVRTPLAPFVW